MPATPSSPLRSEKCAPYPSRQVALADRLLTFAALTMVSPLLLLRGLAGLLRHGAVFEYREIAGRDTMRIKLSYLSGHFPGRSLGLLINLLKGEISWLGPRFSKREGCGRFNPGIFSTEEMRSRIGFVDIGDATEESMPSSAIGYLKLTLRTAFVTLYTGARTRPNPQELSLLGVPISNHRLDETLDWLFGRIEKSARCFVPFVNAHCLNLAKEHPGFHQVLRRADKVLPDGSGVRLACRFHGVNLKDNLNGTDLFPHICERAANEGRSIFLLGAAEGVADEVAKKMEARFPRLNIAGTHHGFIKADDEADIVSLINASGADILLVAMGVPRQEMFLARNLPGLNTTVNLAVGGLFDFYSERISRAPVWLREIGMEWCWRLLQEPGRMWKRYILGNPQFIVRAWLDSRRNGTLHLISNRNSAALRRLGWWLHRHLSARAKRLLDVTASGLGLIALAPLFALTALLIRLESPGSVFFHQKRVGLRGEEFDFWKFRSMYIDAEARKASLMEQNEMDGGVLFKMKNDPRITRVGRFIRRYSIDELPQLWNVLKGDMSLVGPRPAVPAEVAQYSLTDRRRLLAPPGITCIWQVSGRSDIPFEAQVEMDMEYIHQASLGKDVELLLKTVPAVLSGRGAY